MESVWLLFGGRPVSYVLLAVFVAVALAETFRPKRQLLVSTPRRWTHNTLLWGLNTLLVIGVYRASGVAVATLVKDSPFGLLNREAVPYAVRFAVSFALLDLLHYGQHTLYHRVGFLWKVHQIHHADAEFDLTTGFRFHPGEALLTQGITLGVIALLAPPPLAVVAIELASQVQDLFEHGNLSMPAWLDHALRFVLITPDMHRIHHSIHQSEQNRNLGTVFTWWDRLFKTYTEDPMENQETMRLGLPDIPASRSISLWQTLTHPFRRGVERDRIEDQL